jgi:hypothetical protein
MKSLFVMLALIIPVLVLAQPSGTYALRFNGSSTYADVPDQSINLSANFTVECWVYFSNLTGEQTLISKNRDGSMGHDYTCEVVLKKNADNTMFFEVGSSVAWAWSGSSTVATVSPNTWYHFAGVVNNSSLILYMDGVQVLSTPLSSAQWADNSGCDMVLATHDGPSGLGSYLNGYLADVRVWGVARTQVQIQAAKGTGLTGSEVGLQAYFPMSEGSGTLVGDYQLNGLNDASTDAAWTLLSSLPIQLASFAGAMDGGDVLLKWNTVSEVNNYGFDIQRKAGGAAEWTKVGFVAGHGTTVEPHAYLFRDDIASSGSYSYRLKQLDVDGRFSYTEPIIIAVAEGTTGVVEAPATPTAVSLMQNYPNPFNPSTTIRFGVPARTHVALAVYSSIGQLVATLVDEEMSAGYHDVRFDAAGLSSGTYYYRLLTPNHSQTMAFSLVK